MEYDRIMYYSDLLPYFREQKRKGNLILAIVDFDYAKLSEIIKDTVKVKAAEILPLLPEMPEFNKIYKVNPFGGSHLEMDAWIHSFCVILLEELQKAFSTDNQMELANLMELLPPGAEWIGHMKDSSYVFGRMYLDQIREVVEVKGLPSYKNSEVKLNLLRTINQMITLNINNITDFEYRKKIWAQKNELAIYCKKIGFVLKRKKNGESIVVRDLEDGRVKHVQIDPRSGNNKFSYGIDPQHYAVII